MRLRVFILALAALALLDCTAGNRMPGYVYFRLSADPTTLDPALVVDVSGGVIAAKLFGGLLRLDPGMRIVPDLAQSWEVSDDGKTYRFALRRGVKFSSGREVHARDFKYSFERVLEAETRSPKTWIFEKVRGAREFMQKTAGEVEGIRATGDYALEIGLTEPFAPFAGLLTMPTAYVVPFEEVLRWGPDFSSHPVGTGPYTLREWLPNRHLVLDRHEGYFGGRVAVEGIVYRVIPEELTAIAEFELGNLDVLAVPHSEYARYWKSPKWGPLMTSSEGLNTYYLGLNNRSPVFQSLAVRQAVAMGVDRARILDTLYEGRGRLASGPVPESLRNWGPPPLADPHPFDPGGARRLVREAGMEGREVTFAITADQQVVDIAEVIQSYVEAAGLRVSIRQLEWSAFKEAVNRGEADMFWLSWWADYPDAENFLYPLFHSSNHGPGGNRVLYQNPRVDALIEMGRRARSPEESAALYGEAEGLIVADAPWVFFWHRTDYALRQPWMRPVAMHPVYTMDKGLDAAFERPAEGRP